MAVCTECQTPMRGMREKASDFPGTRKIGARGLCHTCYTRHAKAPGFTRLRRPPAPEVHPPDLTSYLERRRQRLQRPKPYLRKVSP